MMSNNYVPPSLVEAEKENIHFNTLMGDAREVIEQLAGKNWTDTALHDPGITLLEALAWNISDISYRCLLPLQDLLTLEDAPAGSGLFPSGFVPEEMLTTSPVTLEDYRRGILDLYHQSSPAGFYFADATISRDARVTDDGAADSRFHYYYDAAHRNFVFKKPEEGDAPRMELFGSYQVSAQISLLPRVSQDDQVYLTKLTRYLEQNRNLGEVFRSVKIVSEETVVPLTTQLEASDSLEDIEACYADIYMALHHVLAARLERQPRVDLARGEYSGPKATYGWITDLPPGQAGGEKIIALSYFNKALASVSGIKAVRELEFSTEKAFFIKLVDKLPVLWGHFNTLAEHVALMLQNVTIYRNGVRISAQPADIVTLIEQRFLPGYSDATPLYPLGRYRHLRRYYPASLVVPPLYRLQQPEPDREVRQLHHFMLGFEQHLASNLQQLENLTRLLNLSAEHLSLTDAYGAQWPFATDSVLDAIYGDDSDPGRKEILTNTELLSQTDLTAMLRLIRYLLSYFGIEDFNKQITTSQQLLDNLMIGMNLLRQVPNVGYERTVFINNQVSSLQRRLAGQLGIGKEMFQARPDISKLSFYVVEHGLLLPDMPPEQALAGPAIEKIAELKLGEETYLVLQTDRVLSGYMTRKHMVDLSYERKEGTVTVPVLVANLLVMLLGEDVEASLWPKEAPKRENSFLLLPRKFIQLRVALAEILALSTKPEALKCSFSNTWLNEMKYLLDEQHAIPLASQKQQYRISTTSDQPWPPVLRAGDTLTLERTYYQGTKNPQRVAAGDNTYQAKVDAVDSVLGNAVITITSTATKEAAFDPTTYRHYWYINPKGVAGTPVPHDDLLQRDRFSFTLSVVLPLRYLGNVSEMSPLQIEAEDQRVRKIVQGEVPAHIQARVLWLTEAQFASFSRVYGNWQRSGMVVGEDSLTLMRMLSLGMLAELVEGIGVARIPNADEDAALSAIEALEMTDGKVKPFKEWSQDHQVAWTTRINDDFLLFVAPDD